MPPARSIRQRVVNNENDENSGTIRLTRAKTAALSGPDDLVDAGLAKKALQSTKSGNNPLKTAPSHRKRAVLGDKSKFATNQVTTSLTTDGKDSKKPSTAKTTLVSKASQNAGVQKISRSVSSRSVLGIKDTNKGAAADLKRPASGSGVMGVVSKKRSKTSDRAVKAETPASENEPPRKGGFAIEIEKRVHLDTTEVIKVEDPSKASGDVKQAFEDGVPDLDAEDFEDPLMVAEYVVEIFEYFKDLELTTMPNPEYMEHQEHLDWQERHVLIDWLIEVHEKFNLLPETLYLAINIIDRFLSTKVVQLEKFQLVGITALFIASKYEEVMSPHVSNFSYVARNDYSDTEILSAERYILSALNYDLSYPNPMNFLRRISKADNYDIQTRTLGKYLLEISVVDNRFMEHLPSHIAAASMYMARLILERGQWDATLSHYSGYTEEEILPVFKLMVDYCGRPIKHEAFHKKYARKKYLKASLLVRQWAKRYSPVYLDDESSRCIQNHNVNEA
ncbi:G2/mitotic-specific cyclin [Xylographa carneopallida]|nr:G2/mitotic-specific cyclin [Xylographa carneopallida]